MDNLSLFTELSQKIRDVELKLDAVLLRLQLCEKQVGKHSVDLNLSTSVNPLDQYISGLTTQSCAPSPIHKNCQDQNLLSQRWGSQPEDRLSFRFQKVDVKENVLDSKSFAVIKRSILINSEQISQMKEKLIELQSESIRRINSVQEGFKLVARLSQLMESRLEELTSTQDIKNPHQNTVKKKGSVDKSKRLIQKYTRQSWSKGMDTYI